MPRRDFRSSLSKSLSQHRLRSEAATRIVASTGLAPPGLVFDLGAGDGQLTAALIQRYRRVVAVEADRDLWLRLRARFRTEPRVDVVLSDLFKVHFPDRGNYNIVSNLPYARTSDFIRALQKLTNPPQETYVVLEREAAARWCGVGGESVASVILKTRFDVGVRLSLRRRDFEPWPATDSVVLRLARRRVPLISTSETARFERFVKHYFERGKIPTDSRRDGRLIELGRCSPHEVPHDLWAACFNAAARNC